MTFTLPLTLSGDKAGNSREHWGDKAKRVKAQRSAVLLVMPARKLTRERNWLQLGAPVVVTLTRVSHRELDGHDNLPIAFKAVVDQVAAQLGLKSDSDPRIAWYYLQAPLLERRALPYVRIELQCVAKHHVDLSVPF